MHSPTYFCLKVVVWGIAELLNLPWGHLARHRVILLSAEPLAALPPCRAPMADVQAGHGFTKAPCLGLPDLCPFSPKKVGGGFPYENRRQTKVGYQLIPTSQIWTSMITGLPGLKRGRSTVKLFDRIETPTQPRGLMGYIYIYIVKPPYVAI